MSILKQILKVLHALVSAFTVVFLLVVGFYCVYALWDNAQVYAAADYVQDELLSMKPETATGENSPRFEELQAVNPDVCAWLTLSGTNIDYPVLQGRDNLVYLNTDVFGEFSLAGSIFLDSGCDRSFGGVYSLVYGHHMDKSLMFGDLDLYKDEKFFRDNTSGFLVLPDHSYELEIFACLLVPSSEEMIFDSRQWQADIDGLLDFISSQAMYTNQDVVKELRTSTQPQIMAMATCASEFTDARTVVVAQMKPQTAKQETESGTK